jgi:hypothetical protein
MLIKLAKIEPRASTKSSDYTSTDHSTSDQDFHSKEFSSATVPTTSGSRDGEEMSEPSNGTSMRFPRPSRTTTGSHTHLISNQTVVQPISDVLQPTQDGGNCSDLMEDILSTKEARY